MLVSVSVLTLSAALTLTFFLCILDFYFWLIHREDRTVLWLVIWLGVSAVFIFCRLLQYVPLSEQATVLVPRLLLTFAYALGWVGYELASAFVDYRPPRWERPLIMLWVAAPVILLWTSNWVLTDQVVVRMLPFGGSFHGVQAGFLYLLASLLILAVGVIPPIRLLRAKKTPRGENVFMAIGFISIILFGMIDFLAVSFNYSWIRLSDYSYLPIAVFFSYIQVSRLGRLYREMDVKVNERTLELRQANETLRASEERYRALMEQSVEAVYLYDLETSKLIETNPVFQKLLGYTAAETNALTLYDIVAHSRESIDAHTHRLLQNGFVNIGELQWRRKDGTTVDVEVTLGSIHQVGKDIGFAVARDITERKNAQERLRDSEDQYRRLVEHSPYGIVVHRQGRVVYVNPAAARLIGAKSTGAIFGQPIMDFVYPSSRPAVIQRLKEMRQGNDVPPLEEKFISLDGRVIDVEVTAYPFTYQNEPAVQVVFNDITQRKQAEEALMELNVALEQRAQEAAAIAEVGRDISETLQLDVVLERIASYARVLLRAETSAVYLPDPAMLTLRAIAAIGPDAEEIKNDLLQIGNGILGNIAMQKSGEIVNDTLADARAITIKGTEDNPLEHLMGVPVISKERLTGLIAVWRTGEEQEFNPADLNFLNSLAGQVAVAIENARLFAEEQKRRQEAETLREAAQRITSTLDQQQAIQLTLEQLAKVVQYESASVQLLREEYLEIVDGRSWRDPSVVLGLRFPVPGDNPNAVVVLEHRAVVLGNAPEAYSLFKDPPHAHIRSWLGVPLTVRDRVIGIFSLDHSQPDFFSIEDAQLVDAFAGQAAIAIENARLFGEVQKHLRELEILQTIAFTVRVAKTIDEALPIILDQLVDLLDVGSALVDLLDPSSGEIVTALARGVWAPVTGMRTPGNVGLSGHVIATNRPYVTTDVMGDGLIALMEPNLVGGLNVVACIPIIAQDQPIGTLWIGRQSDADISAEEIDLLVAIGEMVGNTIHRMSLHERTLRLIDDLQVANRELVQAYDTTLEGWAKALEMRDKETEGHSRRVADLTLRLARRMGIPEPELVHVRRGVLLHDIGKMGLPDQLLRKTGPLTKDEWVEMRKHPLFAEELLAPIPYLRPAMAIPSGHHEKWDGGGYPRGLKGEQIPLAARIFAIVDVYDALLYDRPYRAAWSYQKVLDYLRDQSGGHFDPQVVEAFLALIKEDAK